MTQLLDRELKHRIEAKRRELQATIESGKANALGAAHQASERASQKLAELDELLESGWESLSSSAKEKLNDWLKGDGK